MSTISNENSPAEMASATQKEMAIVESKTDENVNEASDNGERGKNDASTVDTSDTKHGTEYEKFITYDANGTAIYTNPDTSVQYTFDTVTNQWVPLDSNAASTENPYENEHYRWCHETNQWILKDGGDAVAAAAATENEFYRWDSEKKQWIPKMKYSGDCVSEYKDGVHTYTDNDGAVFFWDSEKNAWFPKIDDDFMAVYQMNYGFVDNTSETAPKNDVKNREEESSSKVKETAGEKAEETEAPAESNAKAAKRKAEISKSCLFFGNKFKCTQFTHKIFTRQNGSKKQPKRIQKYMFRIYRTTSRKKNSLR